MTMYSIKPETLETLKARNYTNFERAYAKRPKVSSGDILNNPLWNYYAKPQYSRRTAAYRLHPGNWQTDESMHEENRHASKSDRKYFADQFPDGWRNVGYADDVNRHINHNGWYCDHWQDETCRGTVLQIPAREGQPIYIPAISWSNSDGVTLWPLDWYEMPEDCARAADSYAESTAESDREYYAKDAAELEIEECKESIHTARETVHALIRDIHDSESIKPTICSVLRDRIKEERNNVGTAVRRIRELRGDFWTVVPDFR